MGARSPIGPRLEHFGRLNGGGQKKPGSAGAGRAGDTFESLAASNGLQVPRSPLTLQYLARLGLSGAIAALIAERAFTVEGGTSVETDRDVAFEAISLDQVQNAIEGAHKLKLIVLDACRDNPFVAQVKVTVANRSIGRGLSPVEPTNGTLVVYAAKGGTSAADGEGDYSPFALSFGQRIVEPGIEINKTLRFVRQDVLRKTGKHQEPFVYGSPPPDDFYFVPPK
jgi:hypothetical protein